MILILEVTSPQPTKLGSASRQAFSEEGGSIGRENDNSWVLPHSKVSGHHALITYRNAVYYIEDTSRNGVCLNTSKNRLERGRPYALKSGDRILIDPYDIQVSIARDQDDAPARYGVGLLDARSSDVHLDDPFETDSPLAPRPSSSSGLDSPGEPVAGEEVDPMALLGLGPKQAPARNVPSARDLQRGSALEGHFQPPAIVSPAAPPEPRDVSTIPHGYDPLAPEDFPALVPSPSAPTAPSDEDTVSRPRVRRTPLPPISRAPKPPRAENFEPARDAVPVATGGAQDQAHGADFATVLAGAGLAPVNVTPEIARTFGQILRVVVSGLMDVLRSRQAIKDEFRMRMTRVKPAENNPLKFSANVDDALHNLLVKRNPAYLEPVDAFEDAFADLRHHQIAMLAGMRVAFESMLAEFDPDRLQQDFDRQLNKGLVPAKLRYWDLYRERRHAMVRDPEVTFRRLFGDEFARAYEEQLRQLKTKS